MATYIVNSTGGQLWTKAGNKGSIMPGGMLFDSTKTLTIKDRPCRLIESGPYFGKYVEARDVALYVPAPPPEPEPGNYIAEHEVTVVLDGVTWRCWYPKTPLERVG